MNSESLTFRSELFGGAKCEGPNDAEDEEEDEEDEEDEDEDEEDEEDGDPSSTRLFL